MTGTQKHERTQAAGTASDCNDLLRVIRVTYDSEVLGSGVFWEGRADDINEMWNIPARMLATRVAKHGGKEQLGMWTAELLPPNDRGKGRELARVPPEG